MYKEHSSQIENLKKARTSLHSKHKEKWLTAMRKMHSDLKYQKRLKEACSSKEFSDKMKKSALALLNDDKHKDEKIRQLNSPISQAKRKETMRKKWKDIDYKKKVLKYWRPKIKILK